MEELCCHRCRSGNLVLTEIVLGATEWDEGLLVNDQGEIRARGGGVASTHVDPQPQLTRVQCEDCGHNWHPRRFFAGGNA